VAVEVPVPGRGGRSGARRTAAGDALTSCGDVEQNPGPLSLELVSANVTSLPANFAAVVKLPGNVLALQETRLGEVSQRSQRSLLRRAGWQSFWGKPQPLRMGEYHVSAGNALPGGVGILVREGIPARLVPPVSAARQILWDTGRWCHAEISYGSGAQVLHVMSVYGHAGDGSAHCNDTNDAFLRQVFVVAAELGQVPIFIVGDFNITVTASQVLSQALASRNWLDAAASWSRAQGREPACTCYPRLTSRGSRLDLVLANFTAWQGVLQCDIVPDSGLPTHTPVRTVLQSGVYAQRQLRVVRPLAYPVHNWTSLSAELQLELAQRVWEPFASSWTNALSVQDVEQLWVVFCASSEEFMEQRSAVSLVKPQTRYQGRGSESAPRRCFVAAPQARGELGAVELRQFRLLRLTRRLEEMARWRHSAEAIGIVSHSTQNLWRHVLQDVQCLMDPSVPWVVPLRQSYPASLGELQTAIQALHVLTLAAGEEARASRRRTWVNWSQHSWTHAPGKLYRYTRGEAYTNAALIRRPDGTFTAESNEMDDILQSSWAPVFRMYADIPEPSWDRFAARFGQYIMEFPMQLEDLSAGALRATLTRQSTLSASGGLQS